MCCSSVQCIRKADISLCYFLCEVSCVVCNVNYTVKGFKSLVNALTVCHYNLVKNLHNLTLWEHNVKKPPKHMQSSRVNVPNALDLSLTLKHTFTIHQPCSLIAPLPRQPHRPSILEGSTGGGLPYRLSGL